MSWVLSDVTLKVKLVFDRSESAMRDINSRSEFYRILEVRRYLDKSLLLLSNLMSI